MFSKDPFEYFYPDKAAEPSDIDDVMGQDDTFPRDVDEGMESAYADYSEGISIDYTGESFDEEEEEEEEEGEELLEEAAEILDLAEQGYEGRTYKVNDDDLYRASGAAGCTCSKSAMI